VKVRKKSAAAPSRYREIRASDRGEPTSGRRGSSGANDRRLRRGAFREEASTSFDTAQVYGAWRGRSRWLGEVWLGGPRERSPTCSPEGLNFTMSDRRTGLSAGRSTRQIGRLHGSGSRRLPFRTSIQVSTRFDPIRPGGTMRGAHRSGPGPAKGSATSASASGPWRRAKRSLPPCPGSERWVSSQRIIGDRYAHPKDSVDSALRNGGEHLRRIVWSHSAQGAWLAVATGPGRGAPGPISRRASGQHGGFIAS